MQLSKPELDLFYRLYYSLLAYVNQKFGLIPGLYTSDEVAELTVAELDTLRQNLYRYNYLFELFAEENPLKLSAAHANIVDGWKNFIRGKFYIYSYRDPYAIFIADRPPYKAYGVCALERPFSALVGSALPVMTETVLLPFNHKIIYDGTLQPYPFYFGRSIRGSLSETYGKAIAQFGIIEDLESQDTNAPSEPEPTPEPTETDSLADLSDTELLQFYISSEAHRERYWQEINELIEGDAKLKYLYFQEMGQRYAQEYRDRWREIGMKKAWIALFEEMPIASAATKAELEGILKKLLPAHQRKLVYIYRLK